MILKDLRKLAVPVAELAPLPRNPRKGDVAAIARSLEAFGQRKPIVVRRSDNTVLAGNHTLAAALSLGWTEIAVVWVDDDDVMASAYALADNRTAELGSYDDEALAELIAEVQGADEELLNATGWTGDDLADLLDLLGQAQMPDAMGDPDDVPAVVAAKTVPGDVWICGRHRVSCGDSTSLAAVRNLLDGNVADMVWTDPPYGVNVNAVESVEDARKLRRRVDGKMVANDDLDDDALYALLLASLGNAREATRPGACWFVAAPGGPKFLQFARVLNELGVWRQTLMWLKDQFAMGRSDYHGKHEPIFYGWTPGAGHNAPPDRTQDTVWECPRPRRSPEHPTMKPVALVERALVNHTSSGDLVLDPFGGSGTTLIAAEKSGRTAALMELDPSYVDVICRRFQEFTEIKPVHAVTGVEHDFTV